MRVAVLGGAGAMGSIFGSRLHAAGNNVSLVDVSQAALHAINDKGLTIEDKDGDSRTYDMRVTNDPASVGPVDLIINFVKCYHTKAAVLGARAMVGADTVVLSLQNGWGNAPVIAEVVGEARVLVGLTYNSGTLIKPGLVRHSGIGATFIGEMNGERSLRVSQIASAFNGAGLETTESDRILEEIWKKLALNCCTLPTGALLSFTTDQLVQHNPMLRLMRTILQEVAAVAHAQGLAMDEDERWESITGLLRRVIGGRGSMLQDVESERRTEIDVINGAVSAAGVRLGVKTPTNDALVMLVKSLEASWS